MNDERDRIVAQMKDCVAALQQRATREAQLRNAAEQRAMQAVAAERGLRTRLEALCQAAADCKGALLAEVQATRAQVRQLRAAVCAGQQQAEICISSAMQALYRRYMARLSVKSEQNGYPVERDEYFESRSGESEHRSAQIERQSRQLARESKYFENKSEAQDERGDTKNELSVAQTSYNEVSTGRAARQNSISASSQLHYSVYNDRNKDYNSEVAQLYTELLEARKLAQTAQAEVINLQAQLHFQQGRLAEQIRLYASYLGENDAKIASLQRSLESLLAEPGGAGAHGSLYNQEGRAAVFRNIYLYGAAPAAYGIDNEAVELIVDALAHKMQASSGAEQEALASQQKAVEALNDVVRRQSECILEQQRQLGEALQQSYSREIELLESQAANSSQNEQIASLNAQIQQLYQDNLRLSRLQDDDERRGLLESISDNYRLLYQKDDMIVQLSAMLRSAE